MPRYLGQHFLSDETVLQRIVATISTMLEELGGEEMWEIGPGQGALTRHIHTLATHFQCFEKDETMKKHLGQFLEMEQIVRGDVLQAPLPSSLLGGEGERVGSLLVVGNLPYYITSPIFRKFFTQDIYPGGGVFLIQKEVAQKIATNAKKKSYLRRLLNNMYVVEYLFTVPPGAFSPPPKVDSAVVALRRKDAVEMQDMEPVLAFLDLVGPYTRKTLGKIQKIYEKQGRELPIPEVYHSRRLEELGWEEMREITKQTQ